MRFLKGLAIGLAAVSLVGIAGCSAGAAHASPAGPAAASRATTVSYAPSAAPVSPRLLASARAAAVQFYDLYSARQFATFWSLLSNATKHQVSQHVWVSVHDGCPSGEAGQSRVVKAVTVFGDAAIVTEAIAGPTSKPDATEDVFIYADGRWSYSPGDLSIYLHGSVAADIAAAKAAGFCASRQVF
jgi:hypothetical protein